jgi:hypothetical protein
MYQTKPKTQRYLYHRKYDRTCNSYRACHSGANSTGCAITAR